MHDNSKELWKQRYIKYWLLFDFARLLKSDDELLNLIMLKFSPLSKLHTFQCLVSKCMRRFKGYTQNSRTTYLAQFIFTRHRTLRHPGIKTLNNKCDSSTNVFNVKNSRHTIYFKVAFLWWIPPTKSPWCMLQAVSVIGAHHVIRVAILRALRYLLGYSHKTWISRISRSYADAISVIRAGHYAVGVIPNIHSCANSVMNLAWALLRFPRAWRR